MSEIITPVIPSGIYPTDDTLIILTVDANAIFAATTQEQVIASVSFNDNRGDASSNDGPDFETNIIAGNFVTWIGACKDLTSYPYDYVHIYNVTENDAVSIQNPSAGSGRTHVDARAVNRPVDSVEYSIVFWVYHDGAGRAFQIDPKLKIQQ